MSFPIEERVLSGFRALSMFSVSSAPRIFSFSGFEIKSKFSKSVIPSSLILKRTSLKSVRKISSDDCINEVNSVSGHLDRIKALYNKGCKLEYYNVEHRTFKNNLLFLDGYMPQFIADCLVEFSTSEATSIKECVNKVAQKNPFGFDGDAISFYSHKMKVLLLDAALGMTPATEWTGRYDANGGYIVVKKDGDLVCYHFYNRNDIEDYLYSNTRFDTPSRTRYGFGKLYKEADGNLYFKLNLQIRFKK